MVGNKVLPLNNFSGQYISVLHASSEKSKTWKFSVINNLANEWKHVFYHLFLVYCDNVHVCVAQCKNINEWMQILYAEMYSTT